MSSIYLTKATYFYQTPKENYYIITPYYKLETNLKINL